jgi:membrane-anchored protein YejM (alkaline phosphatase superfamily)
VKITLPKLPLRFIGWFFFANACLFFLISFAYLAEIVPLALAEPTWHNEILVGIFIALAMIGHFSLLAFLPAVLVIPFAFLLKKLRVIQIISICLATVATSLLVADVFVFRLFHYHLNGIILRMLFSKEAMEIFEVSRTEWILIGCALLLILLLQVGIAYFISRLIQRKSTLHGKTIGVSLATILFAAYEIFLLGGLNPSLSLTHQARAFPLFNNVITLILPLPDSLDCVEHLGSGNFVQPLQMTKPLHYPLHPLQFENIQKPLNLLIIVVDTWRFDMLNQSVVPNINRFAQRSWQFKNHWSGGNCTQTGIFSLFYGLPGTYWASFLKQKQEPALIHTLLERGYHTGVYASAELVMPAFHQTIFVHIPHLDVKTPGNKAYERDAAITQRFLHFLERIKGSQKPFFSFLFYDAAHAYCVEATPVKKFQPAVKTCHHYALTNHTDPIPYLNRYKNSLSFIDTEIGKVLNQLEQQGLLKNTVVIITGDHGQEFNDNHCNYWEHAGNYTKYQVQTPLVIYWPKEKPAQFTHWTSHFDICPTLMKKLFGCLNDPKDFCLGHFIRDKVPLSHLLLSSYVDFGIVEPDQTTTIYPTGNYSIHDGSHRVLDNTRLRLPMLQQAIREMSCFYQEKR